MRLQTWKPKKFKEKLIGNHKETQKTLKISGLFHFTRLVLTIRKIHLACTYQNLVQLLSLPAVERVQNDSVFKSWKKAWFFFSLRPLLLLPCRVATTAVVYIRWAVQSRQSFFSKPGPPARASHCPKGWIGDREEEQSNAAAVRIEDYVKTILPA